jgi:hypothetical protein
MLSVNQGDPAARASAWFGMNWFDCETVLCFYFFVRLKISMAVFTKELNNTSCLSLEA